jgi:hypothetical protein
MPVIAPVSGGVQRSRAVVRGKRRPPGLHDKSVREQAIPLVKRRGRDSNPRPGEHPAAVFKTALNRIICREFFAGGKVRGKVSGRSCHGELLRCD